MNAYYNEHDPFAAAWLRELIRGGHITPGVVDERDIQLVQPEDLRGFTRCHFFAGIGGWDHALNIAGWPADRPVWTGSCPCQPFSSAGKGEGFNDPRHLWPTWFRLIRECRPPVVFGEQVASADGIAWFDHVSTDLEAEAYAIGSADLCAAGVGAPHIRQRLFFVADADHAERRSLTLGHRLDGCDGPDCGREEAHGELGACGQVRVVGHTQGEGPQGQRSVGGAALGHEHRGLSGLPGSDGMGDATSERRGEAGPYRTGPEEWSAGASGTVGNSYSQRESPLGPWNDLVWLPCRDGKARPTQPVIQPLAHGVPNRVGTLRGAGNAIVPQVAAQFIGAFLDV